MKRRFSLSLVVLLLLSILFTGCDMVSVVGANPSYRIAETVKDKNGGFGAVGQGLGGLAEGFSERQVVGLGVHHLFPDHVFFFFGPSPAGSARLLGGRFLSWHRISTPLSIHSYL